MNKIIEKSKAYISDFIKKYGWPRVIIGLFLLSLFIIAPIVKIRISTSLSDTIVRFAMNGVMVLAMVPMIHSGCGLNFGLPLGVIGGLLGATLTLQFQLTGPLSFIAAIILSTPFAIILGYGYGVLLNRVKGQEMMIATYVGFSSVAFMSIMWLLLPYSNPTMVWGYGGSGLRTTISVEGYYLHVLNDFLKIDIGEYFSLPLGMILFLFLMCFLMWAFLKTRTGTAMTAVGSNPIFAKASGININKMRALSVVLSTWFAAVGILVYQQSFGFIQLYMAPFSMAMPAVAAILIGGASVNKATITNVLVGTFLFQGILTMTPTVMNAFIKTDMSEVIRIIVSNGMILYALTRKSEA